MTTKLWIDPKTQRVVHFAPASQPVPSRVTQITTRGVVTYDVAQLSSQIFNGALPPAMLPQVCWLCRPEDGRRHLAAALD